MTPPYEDLAALVRRSSDGLLEAARDRLDAPVPGCGDWDVRRLLSHVGRVHRWAAGVLATRAQVAPTDKPAAAGADVVEYAAEGAVMVCDALAVTPPDEQVWNFFADGPAPAYWWARRVAYETLVHEVDARQAAGQEPALADVPAPIAADAVDEFLGVLLPRRLMRMPADGLTGTLHLHATDPDLRAGDGEWQVVLSQGSVEIHRGHGNADTAVRGTSGSLLLLLHNRLPAAALDVRGDAGLLERWRESVTI